ncbi:MAG: substrate-binding domain-containing protein, partial [Casimicrobiaceae bacterium]
STHALLRLRRGDGAGLTPAGAALLDRHRELTERLAEVTGEWLKVTEASASPAHHECVASHDFLVARLPEFARPQGLELDVVFRGSGDAIAALVNAHAALAGFHVPASGLRALRQQMLAPLLAIRDVRMVKLFDRAQGLIVAAAPRRRIAKLADLARGGVRFINRQRGSGTRQLLDALMAAARVDTRLIDGYTREEFTHAAVAATIAADGADAGFGIAAAAAQFGLAFMPLAHETYALAYRRDLFDARAEQALMRTLRTAEWRALIQGVGGYTLPSRVQSLPVGSD